MSKVPKLPIIVNRLIEVSWLNEDPSQFDQDKDVLRQDSSDSSGTGPFQVFFTGSTISDGFYNIPTVCKIALPINSNILVRKWDLSYEKTLVMDILEAELLPDRNPLEITPPRIKYDSPVINIESNPIVCDTLRKYKFYKIRKELDPDNQSENSENSCLYFENLKKLAEDSFLDEVKEENEENEVKIDEFPTKTPKIEALIGFGPKSIKKAEDFSRKRLVEKTPTQDIVSLMHPTTSENVVSMILDEKPESKISISYEIGIEVFPAHALEYLKHKYNIL